MGGEWEGMGQGNDADPFLSITPKNPAPIYRPPAQY